jgi:hypothetical protein
MVIIARRSVFGDSICCALAGSCGDALLTPTSLTTAPAPSSTSSSSTPQSSGLIPIGSTGPGAPAASGQSWTNVFQNVVSSLFGTGKAPSLLNRAPASTSGTSTALVVGGLAVFGLVAYMLTRRD